MPFLALGYQPRSISQDAEWPLCTYHSLELTTDKSKNWRQEPNGGDLLPWPVPEGEH
jgi:hypothetical protein